MDFDLVKDEPVIVFVIFSKFNHIPVPRNFSYYADTKAHTHIRFLDLDIYDRYEKGKPGKQVVIYKCKSVVFEYEVDCELTYNVNKYLWTLTTLSKKPASNVIHLNQ